MITRRVPAWLLQVASGAACIVMGMSPAPTAGTPAPGAASADPSSLFPAQADGYAPLEKDGSYTADTLFDLLDGGAEVYRSFHVRRVASRRYGKAGAPDILADLFDMGSSRDAFGAYHHDIRDGKEAGLGAESELSGSSLSFWKGRYFVSLVALADTPESRRALPVLGGAIAGAIREAGSKPEIVDLLPAPGLERGRISYFHDWVYLNTRVPIAEENLLLLDGETEGVLARYRDEGSGPGTGGGPAHLLLLVRYPSGERAEKALERFRAGYLPAADPSGAARRPDGTWAGARAAEDLVIVVLEAARKPDLERLAAGVRKARTRQGGRP